ncbi:MAG: porin [Hyphomonas sp.]|jgi:predicted porin|nr:porin [Hyphomonas sp.]
MRHVYIITPCLLLALPGYAQSGAPLETEFEFESVTLVTPLADADSNVDIETVLGELSLTGESEKVLDSGLRIRARGALRLQRDHPTRPGGTGGFGSDPLAATGAFSGLSAAPPIQESDLRARLETAYLQIDGGYGEVRVGKDSGVASRFYEGAKSVLSHGRLDSSLLDPTGLSTVRTRNDLTGPSAKVSYASPRLIGIRAGASFTPEADADGLDRRPATSASGLAPETQNAIELALNASRRFRDSGVRIDFGLGWSSGDVSTTALMPQYGSVESWSAGTRIEKDDWTFGASWLSSDNGLPQSDYSAWSAGLHREVYDTEFSAEYGESNDDGVGLDSQSWRVGAARQVTPGTRLAIAYLQDEIETAAQQQRSEGVVVEITLSQKIVRITGN